MDDYLFEFLVHMMIPSLNMDDVILLIESKAAQCNDHRVCVVDFTAMQKMRYKEQTPLLEKIRQQIYKSIQQ